MAGRVIFPRALQYLLAIAEHGSYTRAAEVLHVSQPTLSQQIKQLEDSLDSVLLDRSGRSVRLTDAGEIYVHYARRAFGELDAGTRAIQDVQDLSRGSLRLGWTPITDYLTCSLLETFHKRYPGITLHTHELPQDDIEVAIAEDRIDVGVVFSRPFDSRHHSDEIEAKLLFKERLHVAVGYDHELSPQRKTPLSLAQLANEPLVLLGTNFALRRQIDQYFRQHQIRPCIAMETNSLSVIIEMVQVGTLATILPYGIIRAQCGLHELSVDPSLPVKAITVISRKNGYRSPACLAFMQMASEWSSTRHQDMPARRWAKCPLATAPKKAVTRRRTARPKTARP